jgi:hypothetical protein
LVILIPATRIVLWIVLLLANQWCVILRQSWEETAEALMQEGQDCSHAPASNITRTPPLVAANSVYQLWGQ